MEKFEITFYPDNTTVECNRGNTLLSCAIAAGIYINSSCGGDGVCGRCKVKMGEWIEMGPNGTVLLYTIVEQSFWDALIDGMKQVPFTAAYIELDGPKSVAFSHVLKETDPDKISLGMRVRPVFKPREERVGHLTDILYFESIE